MAKHAKTDEIPAADIPGEAETHAHAEVKVSRKSAALQKAGYSFSAPSLAAPPSVLPSRSLGVLIGLEAFTAMAKGGTL